LAAAIRSDLTDAGIGVDLSIGQMLAQMGGGMLLISAD
jgi:hypothetical protein